MINEKIECKTGFGYTYTAQTNFVPGKARRLKQAKEEAQGEIEQYRAEREKQFKEREAEVRSIDCTS